MQRARGSSRCWYELQRIRRRHWRLMGESGWAPPVVKSPPTTCVSSHQKSLRYMKKGTSKLLCVLRQTRINGSFNPGGLDNQKEKKKGRLSSVRDSLLTQGSGPVCLHVCSSESAVFSLKYNSKLWVLSLFSSLINRVVALLFCFFTVFTPDNEVFPCEMKSRQLRMGWMWTPPKICGWQQNKGRLSCRIKPTLERVQSS